MKLTPTMLAAVAEARANGGKLARYAGGFWMKPDAATIPGGEPTYSALAASPWFGTPTARALVKKGVAFYSDWAGRPDSRFPVEITLI